MLCNLHRTKRSAGPGEVLLATDRLPTGGANAVRVYPDDWLGLRDVCNDSPGSMEYGKCRGRLPCRVILDDLAGKLGEILAAAE